eukprot:TRINITY_DN5792_c0_g1_i2.p1 TRINITY_DN5792_c0_g1~~TRINITY_DN5792_c0_g1_i2.p1  ORF type:complete len:951 (+),score=133.04 TRINITY_DN5792_c0_g1_i2:32-2884(+)
MEQLLNLFGSLWSNDYATRVQAEEKLSEWEKSPGYSAALFDIIAAKKSEFVNEHSRLYAAIIAKHFVETQWDHNVSEEEKVTIRNRIISLIGEESDRIATQLALLLGMLARKEFPRKWPDLVEVLFLMITEGSPLLRVRTLLMLKHVIAALRSRCMLHQKRQFAEIVPSIFEVVYRIWTDSNQQITSTITSVFKGVSSQDQINYLPNFFEILYLSTKVLTGLCLTGYNWSESQLVNYFINTMIQSSKELIEFAIDPKAEVVKSHLVKIICLYGKFLIKTHQYKPLYYQDTLLPCIEYCYSEVINTERNHDRMFEKHVVYSMMFLKECIENYAYKETTEQYRIVRRFLDQQKLQLLVQNLIGKYMLLDSVDLEKWDCDPEEFVKDENLSLWEQRMRPMAQKLCEVIISNFTEEIGPYIINLMSETIKQVPSNMDTLLLKESCYTVMGLVSYDLKDHINFNSWFTEQLVSELKLTDAPLKILHRRIAWMVSRWSNSLSTENRGVIYSSMVSLMKHSDFTVMMAASDAVKELVSASDFIPGEFSPYLEFVLSNIFDTLSQDLANESIIFLVQVLHKIVESMEENIKNYSLNFISLFHKLWDNDSDSFLKSEIILLLIKIINLNDTSDAFSEAIFPFISSSVSLNIKDGSNLLSDGLELWSIHLSKLSALNQQYVDFFPTLGSILAVRYSDIPVCMKILEHYIILGSVSFFSIHLDTVCENIYKLLGDLKDVGTIAILKPVELILNIIDTNNVGRLELIFTKILSLLLDEKESTRIKVFYFSIYSRLLLRHKPYFLSFIQRMTDSPENHSKNNVLFLLLPMWIEKIDNMAEFKRRKLSILAILSLITTEGILPRFSEILGVAISRSIGVIMDEEGPNLSNRREYKGSAILYAQNISDVKPIYLFLIENDLVHNATVKAYLAEQFNILQKNTALFNDLMQHIIPIELQQLQKLLN